MKKKVLFAIGLLLAMTFFSFSADINFKGMVQTWFSVAEQNEVESSFYGFTLRRIRFKPFGSFTKKIQWLVQAAWDRNSPLLLDAYLDFLITKTVRIRVGQFTVPGTVSSTLTSSGKLDFLERAMVTQNWSGHNSLSSYRALGIQVHGSLLAEKLYYALMAANPKTTMDFTPRLKSPGYTNEKNGSQFWARLEAKPVKGMRIGTFYGTTEETETDIRRNTYGAHLFFVTKALNFKIEYIAGLYGAEGNETEYNGMYAVLGYKLNKTEPICRFGCYIPNDKNADAAGVEKYTDITLGVNYFYSKNIKFQANYVIRNEQMAAGLPELLNNLFYCCLQYTF
jgi:phosphate-selective porin